LTAPDLLTPAVDQPTEVPQQAPRRFTGTLRLDSFRRLAQASTEAEASPAPERQVGGE
jgi:hypothetical protein